jgi:hypothetical protein
VDELGIHPKEKIDINENKVERIKWKNNVHTAIFIKGLLVSDC